MATLIFTPFGITDNVADAVTALTTGKETAPMSSPDSTPTKSNRPVVSIDLETMRVNVARRAGQRGRATRFGTLLHYREAPNQTPTGGRFVSRRVTVRAMDGTRWVGQFKTGADTVILRPEPTKKD